MIKDEHGRILATEKVDKRDEESVKPFLQRMKNLGVPFRAFYTDGCRAYFNAIRTVFGKSVAIQYEPRSYYSKCLATPLEMGSCSSA